METELTETQRYKFDEACFLAGLDAEKRAYDAAKEEADAEAEDAYSDIDVRRERTSVGGREKETDRERYERLLKPTRGGITPKVLDDGKFALDGVLPFTGRREPPEEGVGAGVREFRDETVTEQLWQ